MATADYLLGKNIRKIRGIKEIKQDQMAERLGMTQQRYSKIERGETELTEEEVEKIAEALGVKREYIEKFDEASFFTDNVQHDIEHAQVGVGYNTQNNYTQFPPELKQLVEEHILLLKENNTRLTEEVKALKEEIAKLKG